MSSTPDPKTRGDRQARAHVPTGAKGELPWWGYRHVQRSLAAFGSGLQGKHRFPMVFRTTGVNYTDFGRRVVVIDPDVVTDPDPAVQLALVKGAICHEEGHVVFTTPFYGMDTSKLDIKDQLVARVTNVLEDERIDRAMMDRHWGTEKYLKFRKRRLWEQLLEPLDPSKEDPSEVLSAIIQRRYGWELKGSLHPKNQALLDEVWPYVLRAWNGTSTEVARACAEEIVRILGLEEATREQMEKMPQQACRLALVGRRGDDADQGPGGQGMPVRMKGAGQPQPGGGGGQPQPDAQPGGGGGAGDQAADGAGQEHGDGEAGAGDQEGEDGEDLVLMLDDDELADLLEGEDRDLDRTFSRGADSDENTTELTPQALDDAEWEAAARRSAVLVRHLQRIPPKPRSQAVEFGSRYSFRDELRHEDRSFRRKDVPTRQRSVAIGVLVDCSGSMHPMMPQVRASVLSLYRAAKELNVGVGVWGFSSWSRNPAQQVLGFADAENTAPERLAGLVASGGTVLAPAITEAGRQIQAARAERRVMLVIHDGQPSDMTAAAAEIARIKRNVEVVGIFIGDDARDADLVAPMRELFGDRLIVAQDADALMTILGTFLGRLLTPR